MESFRIFPVDSLDVEANEPSLDLRRRKLTLQYIVKLKANIDNSAFDCVFHPQFENIYDKNTTYMYLINRFQNSKAYE